LRSTNVSISSKIRLVFTVPWMLCMVVAIVQSRLDVRPIAVNLVWPFLFFYLVACLLEKASRSANLEIGQRKMWLGIGLLVAADHLLKFSFSHFIPLGESVPVIAGRLHLANIQNLHGNWVASSRGAPSEVVQTFVFSILCVVLVSLVYRFYSERQRKSFWSILAYGCCVAGCISAAIDLGVRGLVVDYLYLPGLFVADLKDLYLIIFESAMCVEVLMNPQISIRWLGWREEIREAQCIVSEFVRFSIREIQRIGRNGKNGQRE